MAFNEAKDRIIDSQVATEKAKTRVLAQLASYDGGPVKLQIKRENKTSDGWTFAKLGRMDPQEFMDFVPVAMDLMSRHGLLGG